MPRQKKKNPPKNKQHPPSYLPGSRVKTSFRRHVLPPLLGVTVMVLVLGLFNSQWLAGLIYKRTYKPPAQAASQDAALAASAPTIDPNAPAKIIINNVQVDAPVIYDQTTINEAKFQIALRSGVVHYPDTAVPGEVGNVVIFGHSSGQVWAPGNYKFVFTHLDKLAQGDKIFLEYKGVRYTYDVEGSRVVPPTDVSVLQPTKDRTLTLITCTPVGTNRNRLIVTAKQTAPVPKQEAPQQPAQTGALTETQNLPSSSTTSLWESIKNWF